VAGEGTGAAERRVYILRRRGGGGGGGEVGTAESTRPSGSAASSREEGVGVGEGPLGRCGCE
jgi:hypothetical protein